MGYVEEAREREYERAVDLFADAQSAIGVEVGYLESRELVLELLSRGWKAPVASKKRGQGVTVTGNGNKVIAHSKDVSQP